MPVNRAFRGQRVSVVLGLACAVVAWGLTLTPRFKFAERTFESLLPATVWGLSFLCVLLLFGSQRGLWSRHALINALLAVVVDMVGSTVFFNLHIPLYMDTVGTVFIAIIYGPVLGMGTAVLALSLRCVFSPLELAYLPNALILALMVGWLARRGAFKRMISTLFAGYGLGIIAALVSLASTLFALNQILPRGARELANFFLLITHDETTATLLQVLTSHPLDKAFTVVLVCLFIRFVPKPVRNSFDRPETQSAVARVLTEDRFTLSLDEEPPRNFVGRLQRYL
ncbi:hypothetical protein QP922_08810 [Corynebacterium sp. MSK218]|uniref:hypothetical protein n=1 Tax=Corynebacterium sp. MSK218 TaxID=3050218 RepID=UPI00254F4271|nr:hypothetical protein [Corynebacterium sp. MSK218]MDK8763918.1 hypothetical protein [Corynebacterium sp. MSK218]